MGQSEKTSLEIFLEQRATGVNQSWLPKATFSAMQNLGLAAQNISNKIVAAAEVITENFPIDAFAESERVLEIDNEMQEVEIALRSGTHFQPAHISALRQKLRDLESEKEELIHLLSNT